MNTLRSFLDAVESDGEVKLELRFVHPFIYVALVDSAFEGLTQLERLQLVAARLKLKVDDIEKVFSHGFAQLLTLTQPERETEYTFIGSSDSGSHWLSWFGRGDQRVGPPVTSSDTCRALHFYGFKGGQARSTVLSMLAKKFADDGLRVLIVDADLEAPSLDGHFEVSASEPSSTLMGLCGWAEGISPMPRVYVGSPKQGSVDLIACRPRSSSFDLDFAGLLLTATLDARILQGAAAKLRSFACGENGADRYDVTLFDHRTGLAPSVLPLMEGWPGSTVIFARPDGMSRSLETSKVLGALLAFDRQNPGAFVTFTLDPKERSSDVLEKNGRFVESLLGELSDALQSDGVESDIDPSELERFWMLWHHDPSLLGKASPTPAMLSSDNQASLDQLREVLALREIDKSSAQSVEAPVLTKSGATDQGLFIRTPEIARLLSKGSPITYVFGRKGTGKTRLVRELTSLGLGTPLLVAQDEVLGGLRSGSALFDAFLSRCDNNYSIFWWAILRAGVEAGLEIETRLKELCAQDINLSTYAYPPTVEERIRFLHSSQRKEFLIDGVETAVPASRTREFVESLFRFLASVQYNKTLSSILSVRLFLRSDLQGGAAQNIEQQLEGRTLNLRWDRVSILNFALGRIYTLPWFQQNFAGAWSEIGKNISLVSSGALADKDAEQIFEQIFPSNLARNKLKLITFLATYFSDAGGDSEERASFYPRLFDGFLREIAAAGERLPRTEVIERERLKSSFVLNAYDDASGAFIAEVRSELYNLLDLGSSVDQNREAVDRLLEGFSGLKTPFVLDDLVERLSEKTQLPLDKIREALVAMKKLGLFEDRPGFPGWWRTGRLYKAGLKMKYVRVRKSLDGEG